MLRRVSRLLLVLALALTMPIQGIAAVTSGACMALGHHDAGGQDGHDHEHDGAGAHCPPCVSCCAAAAITSFSPLPVAERPAFPVAAEEARFFSGVTPDRLDRPPLAL